MMARNIRLFCIRESSTSQIVALPALAIRIWREVGGFHEISFLRELRLC